MAIQQINLGSAPSGAGGDTQRTANTKINQNFSNTAHAASRLVGTENGQIPLAEDSFKAAYGTTFAAIPDSADVNDAPVGSRSIVRGSVVNAPSLSMSSYWIIDTIQGHPTTGLATVQMAHGHAYEGKTDLAKRVKGRDGWSSWVYFYGTHNTTKDSKTNLLLASGSELPENSAASRLVGIDSGKIPLAEQTIEVANGRLSLTGSSEGDFNNIRGYGRFLVTNRNAINAPPQELPSAVSFWVVENISLAPNAAHLLQKAYVYNGRMEVAYRSFHATNGWTAWRPSSAAITNYTVTTSSGSNVCVDSSGFLSRASSSLKYKDVLFKLDLDDTTYKQAMEVKPIVFRSKSSHDPQDWHFLSFAAEELGEYEPALTQWKTHEINPETGELEELEEKEAEGINLNAICAVLHATNIYQDKKIKELEQRLAALESNNEPIE